MTRHTKRDRYGSILVNLDTGKSNRFAAKLWGKKIGQLAAKWQPAIEVITRKHYGKYMRAVTKWASQATEVMDCWHPLRI